jgi:hypothetical protein
MGEQLHSRENLSYRLVNLNNVFALNIVAIKGLNVTFQSKSTAPT